MSNKFVAGKSLSNIDPKKCGRLILTCLGVAEVTSGYYEDTDLEGNVLDHDNFVHVVTKLLEGGREVDIYNIPKELWNSKEDFIFEEEMFEGMSHYLLRKCGLPTDKVDSVFREVLFPSPIVVDGKEFWISLKSYTPLVGSTGLILTTEGHYLVARCVALPEGEVAFQDLCTCTGINPIIDKSVAQWWRPIQLGGEFLCL